MPVTFPNESEAYRAARNQLLESEKELRRHVEAIAVQRRQLPLGGEIPDDYVFDSESGPVRMSELFEDGKDSLVIYSYMYGPQMAAPCPMCTSILDGMDGQSAHVRQRANFVVVARSPIERVLKFTRARGWRNLRLLSSANNSYHRDYHGEDEQGNQWPALNVFARRDGKIHHFWMSELLFNKPEPGEDFRHADMIWPLWNMLDMTPEGRGESWRPKLRY